MGRKARTVSDDDVFHRETREGMAKILEDQQLQRAHAGRAVELARAEQLLENMRILLARGDGWMRWGADRDGKSLFLKYKFTSYRFPNHYVFVSGPIHDVALMVESLLRKCERVDEGSLIPTIDRPYYPQEG